MCCRGAFGLRFPAGARGAARWGLRPGGSVFSLGHEGRVHGGLAPASGWLTKPTLAKPAREVLFTVLKREDKYKAKNFIDTAVSRGGDASTGWLVSGVKALGATTGIVAGVLVPMMLLWGWIGWRLGRQESALQRGLPTARQRVVFTP